MAGRRMRPEPPLTTRLPPLNDTGVIPPATAGRAPSPAARPSRPGIAAPPFPAAPPAGPGSWGAANSSHAVRRACEALREKLRTADGHIPAEGLEAEGEI